MVKNLLAMQETHVKALSQEDALEKGLAIHPILAWRIPQRSLAGYNPWGHKESDTTWKRLSTSKIPW